jgi:hydroxymethylpyrimidine kinase/phosphomethylpyrimidine kinase
MRTVLTIAGFDPSSGAGITRDLDTFFSLGMHGISVPTCFVIQGPGGVESVHPVPVDQFRDMLRVAARGVSPAGMKTGVLFGNAYMEILAEFLRQHEAIPLVIDPVMASKNEMVLLPGEGPQSLKDTLFPLATVVTPNIDEASRLSGMEIRDLDTMKKAAEAIRAQGPRAVVVKGGHLRGEPLDLLCDGRDFRTWQRKRVDRVIHGTGCLFSSFLLAFLAKGYPLAEAFIEAEQRMDEALQGSYRIDQDGYFYAAQGIANSDAAERWRVYSAMRDAAERLEELNPAEMIPEVQMNLGYAMTDARGTGDVAAFPGRIGRHGDRILIKGDPAFGASSHVARLILTVMEQYRQMRSAANLRYDERILAKAREKGFRIEFFDRMKGPQTIKEREGKSLDFLVGEVLKRVDGPPDVIYDKGDVGKEPIIRLFAENPLKLIEKMEMMKP